MNSRLIIGGIISFIVFCLIIYFAVFHKKKHHTPVPLPPIQKLGEDNDILKLADDSTIRVKKNTWKVEPSTLVMDDPSKTIDNVDFYTDVNKMCLSVCENDPDCIMVTWDGGACNLYNSSMACPVDLKKLKASATPGTEKDINIDNWNTFYKHDLQPSTDIDKWSDSVVKRIGKKTLDDSDPKWCFLLPSKSNIKYQKNTERSIDDESTGAKYNITSQSELNDKCINPCINDSECIGWNLSYDAQGPSSCSLKNSNAECSTSTTTSDFYYKGGNAAYEKKCPPT